MLALGWAVPVLGQGDGTDATAGVAVVQPLPPQAASELSVALKQLGRNSSDGPALIAAGWASLKLDNIDAATGFFTRATNVPAVLGDAKAGLAAVQVNRKHPVDAIKLFDEAEMLGAQLGTHASERGLAYDLVGDNARAQELYRQALAAGKDDETIRRLALSQAIGGDPVTSEATLLPLLQHRDLAAYRTRAFALAAQGRIEEAVAIADAVMSPSLASRIAPYLRHMPKLTRAQQAAAANFGHFPDAGSIGQDDPRIAEYTALAKAPAAPGPAIGARLTPSGAPFGAAKPIGPSQETVITVVKADTAPVAPPVVHVAAKPAEQVPPPIEVAVVQPLPEDTPAPISVAVVQPLPQEPPPPQEAAPVAPVPAQVALEPAAPALAPAPARLAEAFAGFTLIPVKPEAAPGAVDVTKIEPPRPEPKPVAKPAVKPPAKAEKKKPAHPSRIWVQVATGRDKSALAYDWRRFTRENAKTFAGRKPFVVKWGQTNRLVTGPFTGKADAAAFLKALKAAGIDAFSFTSDEGEAVDPLPGK